VKRATAILVCGWLRPATLDRFSEADAIYAVGHREADQLGPRIPAAVAFHRPLLAWGGRWTRPRRSRGRDPTERLTALQPVSCR
jgi:hypothetical protein